MEEAPREIVDLARMCAVYERDRENLRAAADPEAPSVTRVVVRVLEDVHLEARAGGVVR